LYGVSIFAVLEKLKGEPALYTLGYWIVPHGEYTIFVDNLIKVEMEHR
jgi:hypothetical protein